MDGGHKNVMIDRELNRFNHFYKMMMNKQEHILFVNYKKHN